MTTSATPPSSPLVDSLAQTPPPAPLEETTTKANATANDKLDDANDQQALLVILSVNDVYDMYPDQQGRGGIAELATLLERERAKVPPHAKLLVTLNGDFLSGSQVGEIHKGAHMIELMNHLGIEYVVLGNHEFDFGGDTLLKRMADSQFKWFGSNVKQKSTGDKIFQGVVDTEIVQLADGLTLGIFGVVTQDTPNLSFPGDDVYFDNVFDTSKRCVHELQEQGADFILALTHLSIAQDKLLARKVPGIDLMLGGHDHEPFTLYEGKTLIHKSGQNAVWLARMEFTLAKSKAHPERPLAISPQWTMIANQGVPPERKCQEIIAKYMKVIMDQEDSAEAHRVLAVLGTPLSTKTAQLRSGECNSGNLAADALRSELSADFGLINGGFIRGDKTYEAKTNLTAGVIDSEMPFPRPAVLVRILARDFRDAILQHFSKYPQQSGSYPHISGLRIVIDRKVDPVSPKIVDFKDEQGNDIDLDATVQVATTAFIARGGDGCDAWLRGEVLHELGKIADVLKQFLMKKRLVAYPETEGRITIVE